MSFHHIEAIKKWQEWINLMIQPRMVFSYGEFHGNSGGMIGREWELSGLFVFSKTHGQEN
jgi:hypothetical protein